MTGTPELSIIMLAYNSINYIRDAVESIIKQTFKDFELIIIDDGSTDGTTDYIKSIDDKRARKFFNKENRGISFCRNMGIKIAKGEYISFFDSDDIAHKEKYKVQIDFLKSNKKIGFAGTSVIYIDGSGNKIKRLKLNFSKSRILPYMLFHNCFVNSSVVFKREVLQMSGFIFPKQLIVGEDYLLWWNLLKYSKGCNISRYLTYYRQHVKSIMKKTYSDSQQIINNDTLKDIKTEEATDNDSHKSKTINILEYYAHEMILNDAGIFPDDDELKIHLMLKGSGLINSADKQKQLALWLLKISEKAVMLPQLNRYSLFIVIMNRWLKGCYASGGNTLLSIRGIFNIRFYRKAIKNCFFPATKLCCNHFPEDK